MKKTKIILHVLILLFLVFPLFQKLTGLLPEGSLHGDFSPLERDTLNWNNWFSEKYQTSEEAYLNNNISFRSFLVRLNNQIDFSLFNVTHADGVTIGKNNMLYEYDYIQALNGDDFIGEKTIERKMRRLKFIQDHLNKNYNTELVVVLEPGKATVFPENIKPSDLDTAYRVSNYKTLVRMAKKHQVDYLDLDVFFRQMKDTSSFPVYPKYGTHWSNYGMYFAFDTLLNYLGDASEANLSGLKLKKLEKSKVYRHPDYDIGNTLNLLFPLKPETMAYPILETDTTKGFRPDVLAVADSYYWNIYNTGIPDQLFKNHKFWYFCKLVYPDYYHAEKFVDRNSIAVEFEKRDIVIIMMTHRFFYKFAWGLIDELYRHYAPVSLNEKIIIQENKIKEVENWFNNMIIKSDTLNMPLEDVLRAEAEYLTFTSDLENYLILKGVEHYKRVIRENYEWYQNIIGKAQKERRTIDEQLELDARYVFNKGYPHVYEKMEKINDLMNEYKNDSSTMENTDKLASKYNTTREEMLRIVAEKIVLENFNMLESSVNSD